MSLQKPVKEITLEDIKSLIENKIPEGKTIDYKQSLSIETPGEKIDFYKDVSAFANAEGGDIVYGVTEEDRFPQEIVGVEISDIDNTLSALQDMIRTGIEPTIIPQPEFSEPIPVPQSENKYVIVLRVYKSYTGPHRISFNKDHRFFIRGDHKFFIRGDGANGEMSVTELRNAFILSQTLIERVQKFRLERLHRIISKETPVPLVDEIKMFEGKLSGKLVIHIIPLQAFHSNEQIDVNRGWEKIEDNIDTMRSQWINFEFVDPLSKNLFPRINLEGLLVSSFINKQEEVPYFYTYTQLFRNGIIEGVRTGISKNSLIQIDDIRTLVVRFVEMVRQLYKEMSSSSIFQISGPKYIFITLIGTKGCEGAANNARPVSPTIFPDDLLQLPEVVLDESNEDKPFEEIFNPTYKILLNAFGWVLDDNKK